MIGLILTILAAVAVALIVTEITGGLVAVARHVVRAGARRVPRYADRLSEEWLGEIERRADRPLSALGFSLKLYREAGQMRRPFATRPDLSPAAHALKRVFDVVVAALMLFAVAPLMTLIASTIRLVLRGPVFYRKRVRGRQGRPVDLLRFRILHVAPSERPPALGRLLRRLGFDSLPLFWTILKGEMSLVGPWPLPENLAAHLDDLFPDRPDLAPGLISPAYLVQRKGGSVFEQFAAETRYVEGWTLWRDLKIMASALLVTGSGPPSRP